ncbi:serine hydrolase domain-containing protein [Streptomyces sp. NPDC054796]
MPLRTTLVAMVVTAAVVAFSISSSEAADRGHATTQGALDAAVTEDGAPGVLARAEDGGGVWNGASGVARLGTERPRLPQDRFRIGSLTKPFVATVLLQLEAEGRLRLDDPVERWLPGTVSGDGYDGRRITLRQLLGHTSGIYDYTEDAAFQRAYFTDAFMTSRFRPVSPEGLVRTATSHPPVSAPGAAWHYSNTNYVLAGMVIERVTGHSYAHEIERRVLRPLGLRDTSLPGASTRVPGRHGHAYSALLSPGNGAKVHDVTVLNPAMAGASGEMISTTGDLVRFFRALATGELLPPHQSREMRTTVPAVDGNRYGLGLTERTLPCGQKVWGHEGSIQGSRTIAATTPDGVHTAAFNINGDWSGDPGKLLEAEFCG